MLELGSRWLETGCKSLGRDIKTIAEIATIDPLEGYEGEMVFYRFEKTWPFYTEDEIKKDHVLVASTEGVSHHSKARQL